MSFGRPSHNTFLHRPYWLSHCFIIVSIFVTIQTVLLYNSYLTPQLSFTSTNACLVNLLADHTQTVYLIGRSYTNCLSYWPIIYKQFILLADHRQTVYLIGRSYTNCLSYWPTTYKQFILFADHIQTVYLIGRSYINSLSYWPIICKQLTRLWLASLFTAFRVIALHSQACKTDSSWILHHEINDKHVFVTTVDELSLACPLPLSVYLHHW